MLTDKQVQFLREELATAKNPLFFYDGDGDGLASFLLLYKINREGKGISLTSSGNIDGLLKRKVDELDPDKIFVLDVPSISQDFIDYSKRPIFWIDHHQPQERKKVHYFNPRIKEPDAYIPTSRMAWQVSERDEDLWIATIGCLADYHLPDFIDKFIELYPKYLSKKVDLSSIIFKQPVGKLVRLFFFLQKGPSSEVRKSIKVLSRINSPDEIFEQESNSGKFLYKRFENLNGMYEELLSEAKKCVTRSKLLLFNYSENKWSFTTNLANELIGLYPKKMVIIARRKSGEVKCSLRGDKVQFVLEKSLVSINGRGGGHLNACGAVIKEEDWQQFLKNFKREMK